MATAAQLTTAVEVLQTRHDFIVQRLDVVENEVRKVKWRLTGILVTLMLGVAALAGNAFLLLANRP